MILFPEKQLFKYNLKSFIYIICTYALCSWITCLKQCTHIKVNDLWYLHMKNHLFIKSKLHRTATGNKLLTLLPYMTLMQTTFVIFFYLYWLCMHFINKFSATKIFENVWSYMFVYLLTPSQELKILCHMITFCPFLSLKWKHGVIIFSIFSFHLRIDWHTQTCHKKASLLTIHKNSKNSSVPICKACLFNLMTISQILSNSSFQVSNFTTVLIHTMHVIYD